MTPPPASQALLDALRAAVGAPNVLTDGDLSACEQDWRRRWRGRALAVVRPGSTDETAAVVRACAAHGAPIVAQGGNTGLVGGSVPDDSGTQVLLSLGAHEPRARHRHRQPHDDGGRRLRAAGGPGSGGGAGPAVALEPGGRRQLHDRRQPRHQRRRHPGAALRQCARAVPRARGGDGRRRRVGGPGRPAQGQHRLRPARPLHRQRRHARHHHRRHAAAVPAAGREDHLAGRLRHAGRLRGAAGALAGPARRRPDRLRSDERRVARPGREALPQLRQPLAAPPGRCCSSRATARARRMHAPCSRRCSKARWKTRSSPTPRWPRAWRNRARCGICAKASRWRRARKA